MTAHVLTGSKLEIAQKVANLQGEVREAVVFIEEPATTRAESATVEDLFAEMEPHTVKVGDVDDSRNTIYTRLERE